VAQSITRFLHFLCKLCGQSASFPSGLFLPVLSPQPNSPPRTRLGGTSSRTFLVPVHPPKSAPELFLNCTKNTELTPRPFTRTFSFAFNQKTKSNSAEDTNRHETKRTLYSTSVSHHHTITAKLVANESNNPMDYLPHPFFGQSQTTHHQPEFHRRPRPSALRSQRRLSRRILRRCSPHRAPSNLRGYLRPPACRRDFRINCSSVAARDTAANPEAPARPFAATPSPRSKISAAGSRYPGPGLSLSLGSASTGPASTVFIAGESRPHHCFGPCRTLSQLPPHSGVGIWTSPFSAVTLGFCECTMNSPCGKLIRQPRIKPVIAGDTTYGVNLLTDTISGSNFAIPWL